MKRLLASAGLLFLVPGPGQALEWIPLGKLDLLGGQFFFQDRNTSFSGNADWLASPGMKLSDQDTLVPIVSGQYRHTREVQELIGGGFLTQESLDNIAMVKWIHSFSEDWSLKPSVSFKNEMIVESQDESLGKGLFDYDKLAFGVEAERKGERLKSLRQAFNAYGVRFYHYQALSSQASLFGTEINSGNRVLDFNAFDYSIAADYLPRENTLLNVTWLASYRPFLDQRIVKVTGEFEGNNRVDLFSLWQAGAQQKLPAWAWRSVTAETVAGLNAGFALLESDQNDFDASQTRFNGDYYSYGEATAGSFIAMRFNKKFSATVAYDYSHRGYHHRPAQNSDSTYTASAITMDSHTISAYFSYPVYGNLSLKVQGSYRAASSNMKLEKVYLYNYHSANYFVGFGYAL